MKLFLSGFSLENLKKTQLKGIKILLSKKITKNLKYFKTNFRLVYSNLYKPKDKNINIW
jgi:hypothetical protein